ncbi:MAG: hydroxymethylglutaryl-CoA synthase [Saprospiraceae bacterium]
MLKHNPRLLAIDSVWGVGMEPVYDFYKPLRKVSKAALISEVLQLANRNHVDVEQLVQQLQKSISVTGVLDSNEEDIYLHKDTPVFDGPYSNDCYQARIREALAHYARQAGHPEGEPLATTWDRLIFHLPYAFQARRMFGEIFWYENAPTAQAAILQAQAGMEYPQRDAFADEAQWQAALQEFNRAITKTTLYHDFINQRIAPSEWASSLVGNMYAGSILLALVSTLEVGWKAHTLSAGHTFGFFAYGSGSKSKVFTARLQPEWEKVAARLALGSQLENRIPLEYDTYEKLHRKVLKTPLYPQLGCFYESAMDDAGVRTHRLPQKQQVG